MTSVARSSLAALAGTSHGGVSASRGLNLAVRGKTPTPNEPPGVAVVDDDDAVREAFAFQLNTAGFRAVTYSSARELLEASDASSFECILADIYLPGMNGLELQHELRHRVPGASVIFVTGHGDLSIAINAMRNGAVDFLEKPVDDATFLSAVTRAIDLSRARHAQRAERFRLEQNHRSLTAREREVFALITKGLLNKQAAYELGITERTVKAHRGQVMSKMRAGSLADLVRMAGMLGIHRDHAAGSDKHPLDQRHRIGDDRSISATLSSSIRVDLFE
jgi:FixJ family two-component response regulator